MKRKYLVYFLVAFLASLGWNIFLIKRDKELFKAHSLVKPPEQIQKQ